MDLLIVEDEPIAQKRYCNYIKEYGGGYNIIGLASTYDEAINCFETNKPDIIFTDIIIPGGTGLDFLQYAREKSWSGIFVVISGYDKFHYAKKAIQLKVFDFLVKPVFKNDFFEVLDKVKLTIKDIPIIKNKYYNEDLPLHIRKAMKYVEHNYSQEINLSDVANIAGVSVAYLSSNFSKQIKITFVDFVKYYRVKIASDLLKNKDLSLEEIADKVGFCDASYLNRCFKKVLGVSPGKYRLNKYKITNKKNL